MDRNYAGPIQAGASQPREPQILEGILDRQGSHAATLQNVRQRLSDLADRLRGRPNEVSAKDGPMPPREVPSNTVRKFEMVTEDIGQYIAQIEAQISRIEAL
jgi:hypothetical protein